MASSIPAEAQSQDPTPTSRGPAASGPASDTPPNAVVSNPKSPEAKPEVTKPATQQYEVIRARMPDGTVKKVKRPIKTAKVESTGTAEPSKGGAADDKKNVTPAALANSTAVSSPKETAANIAQNTAAPPAQAAESTAKDSVPDPAPSSAEIARTLQAQGLEKKQQARQQFKRRLFSGVARLLGSEVVDIPDLEAGGEALSGDDQDEDSDALSDASGMHDENTNDDSEQHAVNDEHDHTASPDGMHLNTGAAIEGLATATVGPTPSPPPAKTQNEKQDGTKVTYKFASKELEELDEKTARDVEAKPLQRRWAVFSFYLMASLSVVLPMLFVVLGILLFVMNGRSTLSSWGDMENVVKAAVTAWPIVFAAVVAQAFKTWATWKVERGVKLGELEQLVGSNSFAAAMKQPLLLRSLDFLTLGLFAVWCLSPIGSQALQRAYTVQRGTIVQNLTVSYLKTYGSNRLFAPNAEHTLGSTMQYSTLLQAASVYYISSFMPPGEPMLQTDKSGNGGLQLRDQYNFPFVRGPVSSDGSWTTEADLFDPYSAFGVPVALPFSTISDYGIAPTGDNSLAAFESVTFPINSSVFELTCNSWQQVPFVALNTTAMPWSTSETLAINFTMTQDNSTIARLGYATLADPTAFIEIANQSETATRPQNEWQYLYIECNIQQVFVAANISCSVDTQSGSYLWSCENTATRMTDESAVPAGSSTDLRDFAFEFASAGNPISFASPTTPTERYANDGRTGDGDSILETPSLVTIENAPAPADVADNLGFLLNTWISIGYCPECVTSSPEDLYNNWATNVTSEMLAELFVSVNGTHTFSSDPIFVTQTAWAVVALVGSVALMLVGAAGVLLEARLVAPDTLGYVSTVVRNSRYLHLPKTAGAGGAAIDASMSGAERARALRNVEVMVQDVKADANVGKIALGMKTDAAVRLHSGRLYR